MESCRSFSCLEVLVILLYPYLALIKFCQTKITLVSYRIDLYIYICVWVCVRVYVIQLFYASTFSTLREAEILRLLKPLIVPFQNRRLGVKPNACQYRFSTKVLRGLSVADHTSPTEPLAEVSAG